MRTDEYGIVVPTSREETEIYEQAWIDGYRTGGDFTGELMDRIKYLESRWEYRLVKFVKSLFTWRKV